MKTTVIIENLKCDVCKQKVITATSQFNGISKIAIDISKGSLSFNYRSHNALEGLRFHLSKIGHPITQDTSLIRKNDLQHLINNL